jgi:hypothetical protein
MDGYKDGGFIEKRVGVTELLQYKGECLSWVMSDLPKDARFRGPVRMAMDADELCFRFQSVEFPEDQIEIRRKPPKGL